MILCLFVRFVLSSGKDSTVKLWEIASGRMVKEYIGAKRLKLRSQVMFSLSNFSEQLGPAYSERSSLLLWVTQAIFNDTEEFVISIDEGNNEVVTWDARTAEKVAKWPSNHNGVPRWIEHSPVEPVFVTCGTTDRSVRFWKESV